MHDIQEIDSDTEDLTPQQELQFEQEPLPRVVQRRRFSTHTVRSPYPTANIVPPSNMIRVGPPTGDQAPPVPREQPREPGTLKSLLYFILVNSKIPKSF